MGKQPKEKFYVTTAIDYTNSVPHIGHMLEKIQADVIARYAHLQGKSVFFLTGTDEHGTKVYKTAQQQGILVKKFADANSKAFKELKKLLNLSWNEFIRTTDQKKHWPGVIKMWKALEQAGDLYKRTYRGLYCTGCETFLTEKDLVEGKCPIHLREPELIEEENYFFRLSAYTKTLRQKIKSKEFEIIPETRANEILALIDQGLDDVSFSRASDKLPWGIPVPGDSGQTMYVWADALTNYLSGIGYGRDTETFKKWWPADVQVIGKDILRFHAAIWPAMLLSAQLPLPKKLFVHGFINSEGQKMSKSLGNVVYPQDVVQEFGTDSVRYYFLREISPTQDGDYSRQRFVERYNADLANGLGNLVARVTGVALKFHKLIASDFKMMDLGVEQKIKTIQKSIDEAMQAFRFNDALAELWSLIAFADSYINDKKPWSTENPAIENEKVLFNLLVLVNSVGVLLEPFMPETSKKIVKNLDLKGKEIKIKENIKLFPRIEVII
ncbi:MAG: methionine--tRNA ligase [Patescibacteria group bacterium]|nr:methionine--tRNA ligase [Patescibacteria group bacterium]